MRLRVRGRADELLALGERLKAPMVHALRGKKHVEGHNPYDVGMTGLKASPPAIIPCARLIGSFPISR